MCGYDMATTLTNHKKINLLKFARNLVTYNTN